MSATQTPVLEVSNLSARYGKVGALVGATLTVPAGSIVTVIGANGAGKSTMLNAMMGSLPQTGHAAGTVQYAGTDVSSWQVERRVAAGMSLVPERRELFGTMSVEDNLLLGGFRRYRAREAGWRDTLNEVFDLFPRLRERRAQQAGTLSGGERQRVALARALVTRPVCVLADEPTGNLDRNTAHKMFELLTQVNQESGTAFAIVTHDQELAGRADRQLLMENGRLVSG